MVSIDISSILFPVKHTGETRRARNFAKWPDDLDDHVSGFRN